MAKTKALISCAVTAQLICGFVFANANCWFSHAAAQFVYYVVYDPHRQAKFMPKIAVHAINIAREVMFLLKLKNFVCVEA